MNKKLISMALIAGIMFSATACNKVPGNSETTAAAVTGSASTTGKETTIVPSETTAAMTQVALTNEQALTAITNYLYKEYGQDKPSGDAPSYWNVDETQTDDKMVVVDWRSYTAAHVFFYIDRASGETYVMESEPGKEEKVKTDRRFNARDYLNK